MHTSELHDAAGMALSPTGSWIVSGIPPHLQLLFQPLHVFTVTLHGKNAVTAEAGYGVMPNNKLPSGLTARQAVAQL